MQTPRGPGTKWKKGEKEELLAGEAGKRDENWGPVLPSHRTPRRPPTRSGPALHSSPPTNCSFTLCPGEGASEHHGVDGCTGAWDRRAGPVSRGMEVRCFALSLPGPCQQHCAQALVGYLTGGICMGCDVFSLRRERQGPGGAGRGRPWEPRSPSPLLEPEGDVLPGPAALEVVSEQWWGRAAADPLEVRVFLLVQVVLGQVVQRDNPAVPQLPVKVDHLLLLHLGRRLHHF